MVISLEGISYVRKGVYILNDISCKIPHQKITCIVGPNGAGKTTLFKILFGLMEPTEGHIKLGEEVDPPFRKRIAMISYMPEQLQLYPQLTVSEIIDFASTLRHKNTRLLNELAIGRERNKKIKFLSKGYKQRIKLYLIFTSGKEIILLDEPFDGFDPLQLIKLIRITERLREEGHTLIISIHNLSYAEKICDYFLLIKEGKLVAKGTLAELRASFRPAGTLEQIFVAALE